MARLDGMQRLRGVVCAREVVGDGARGQHEERALGLEVALAEGFWTRLRGVLGRGELGVDQGLLLTPCAQVHSFGLGYALDVVYLDGSGRVLKCVAGLKPWRVSGAWGARRVLELGGGALLRWDIRAGDRLSWEGMA
ncbi:MAG TPA: DUF192 domain-containing protein [Gammaproteobacteria bacterium]|nr:DUF192 domain-containing protein [Gammaproteobacteria bacterium]